MRHSASSFRPAGRAALLVALVACLVATSGCSIFRTRSAYALEGADRPLELPPELATAETGEPVADGATSALRSATGSQRAPSAASGSGFNVAAPREQVFARVGEALAATEGLEIASQAQLLGAYDVSYRGANFLVRVSDGEGGTYVSAVDPRGLPAQGDGPTALMASLKAALGGN